eukprot:TRINITY_DN321_c2_g1_i1.p1 TRINITY_DN321_c2_g1~~TRINITY_DN321_c2_g1_i1.p1  ORF type:complete len:354 (+),score=71.44 TRINITY_DN321_c2_g1_i1:759-1820(+)
MLTLISFMLYFLSFDLLALTRCVNVLQDIGKFEGVFLGEGLGICEGTSAIVEINEERVVKSEQDVIEAVSKAITEEIQQVVTNSDTDTVLAAAETSSKKILQVIATAVASVSGSINSPSEGCWGIAYGQAEATAIANATVSAIAEAFAAVNTQDASAEVFASSVQQDIQAVVEEVALLIADGSGGGEIHDSRTVVANATAQAINCALAKALGGIIDGEAQAIVLAATSCEITGFGRIVRPPPQPEMFTVGCPCISLSSLGAPAACGQWGETADYICYVKSGFMCPCAVPSKRFDGLHWRYCGPTLKMMQQWLGLKDDQHEIQPLPSASAYCNAVDMNGVEDTVVDVPRFRIVP